MALRLRYLKAPRDIAVVKAAAERAGWQTRPSPNPDRNGATLVGRGIAYAQRSGAVVAIVADDIRTRRARTQTRLVCARIEATTKELDIRFVIASIPYRFGRVRL